MNSSAYISNCKDKQYDRSILKIRESYPNAQFDTESENFPHKLLKILSKSDREDIISWTPNGKAFKIHDKDRLMQALSPCYYFEATKYDNFMRKLNRWGFKIMKHGIDAGAFHHEYFIRNKPELCSKITRVNGKNDRKRKSKYHDGEQLHKKALNVVNISFNSGIKQNEHRKYTNDKKTQDSNKNIIQSLCFKNNHNQFSALYHYNLALVQRRSEIIKNFNQDALLKASSFCPMIDKYVATIGEERGCFSPHENDSALKNMAKPEILGKTSQRKNVTKLILNNACSPNTKDDLNNKAPYTTIPFMEDVQSFVKRSANMSLKKKMKSRKYEEERNAIFYCDKTIVGEKELMPEVDEKQLNAAYAMLDLRKDVVA